MKRLFLAACGLLFLGACAALAPDNNSDSATAGGTYNADGVFVAYCSAEPAPVIFTKEGFPIIDDQACIPEPEVLGIQVTRVEKSCPDGKLLVGNVCLSHNPSRRTQPPLTCSQQGLFDTGDGCEDFLTSCPETWQTVNTSTNTCEGSPTCADLGQYDTGTTCEDFLTSCPETWQSVNTSTNTCEGSQTCVDLGQYDTGDGCEDFLTSCPETWQTVNTSTNTCEGSPTCADLGQYDTGTTCEDFLTICPETWQTVNTSTNTCEGSPTCTDLGQYDTGTTCEDFLTSCPETWQTVNTSTNTCEGSPTCADLGQYDTGTTCEDFLTSCPETWQSVNTSTNTCEGTPPPTAQSACVAAGGIYKHEAQQCQSPSGQDGWLWEVGSVHECPEFWTLGTGSSANHCLPE